MNPRTLARFTFAAGRCLLALAVLSRAPSLLAAPPAPTLTSTFPAEPAPPSGLSVPEMQPYFDTYAWQAMIALCWPAAKGARGEPAAPNTPLTFQSAPADFPTVWSSYRVATDLFPPKGGKPPTWNGFLLPWSKPPGAKIKLSTFQKLQLANDSGLFNQAFGYPLIDQHGGYTMYNEYFNELEYTTIANNKWYQRPVLEAAIGKTGIQLPNGSIELKASWRPLTSSDDASRFYTVSATFSGRSGITTTTVGLVGLHIAVKTAGAPQWLWATFEQVDNVVSGVPGGKASYNSGGVTNPHGFSTPVPQNVPPFPKTPDAPVEVNRVTPILASTQAVNAAFRKLVTGTVWTHYQLIECQWPTAPAVTPADPDFQPSNYTPALAGNPFPRFVANTTMETYFQGNDADVKKKGNTSNSCMQCHYHAAAYGTDYSWALYNRAYPPLPAAAPAPVPTTTAAKAKAKPGPKK